MLGYDVLFQDADVIWLRDPLLEYFHKPEVAGDFDVYFQDDGARSTRFAPFFANSGFYYFRSNPRVQYLMTSLVYGAETERSAEQTAHISSLKRHVH